jgi:drug/metabolite transporter (DMT)-like permease
VKTTLVAALAIAITGQVLYHVAQKMVAPGANPVVSLLAFYAVAALCTLPLFAIYPIADSIAAEIDKLNWAIPAVALSIVLIEIGFLLAYRAGGELSNTFVVTGGLVAVITLAIGSVFLKEAVSVARIAGVAMCIGGIALISWKTH